MRWKKKSRRALFLVTQLIWISFIHTYMYRNSWSFYGMGAGWKRQQRFTAPLELCIHRCTLGYLRQSVKKGGRAKKRKRGRRICLLSITTRSFLHNALAHYASNNRRIVLSEYRKRTKIYVSLCLSSSLSILHQDPRTRSAHRVVRLAAAQSSRRVSVNVTEPSALTDHPINLPRVCNASAWCN